MIWNLIFGILAILAGLTFWIALGADVVEEAENTVLQRLPLRIKVKLWLSLPLTMKDEQWMDRAIAEAELEKERN